MSMCLQSMVDELIMKKHGTKRKQVDYYYCTPVCFLKDIFCQSTNVMLEYLKCTHLVQLCWRVDCWSSGCHNVLLCSRKTASTGDAERASLTSRNIATAQMEQQHPPWYAPLKQNISYIRSICELSVVVINFIKAYKFSLFHVFLVTVPGQAAKSWSDQEKQSSYSKHHSLAVADLV